MNKQQAIQLVKETLEAPFAKTRFTVFIKNLLNHIEESSFTYQGKYVPDAFAAYVHTLERIGKYADGDHKVDILIVTLKKENSVERARTRQRNFIAWYLNGSRGGEQKDAALVAFVSPDAADWRFSLVKMEYRFEETAKGRLKVKEEFTPARRWSFLVGAHEKSHTAQSRLVPIMADDQHDPTLAELEEAFNIEKVTKEFFEKYRDLFIRTKEELDRAIAANPKSKADFAAKGIDTVNLAKKLLGQIIFLYYLQKKGWFGVPRDAAWGQGSKQFLRELFERKHGGYQNFFNDILEPLFYEALRIDRSHDDHYYSRFNCKIPFLNGGLFDPMNNYDWVRTDILLPNALFSNTAKTKEGDIGDGILDIFDRYNFTVQEDEPFEKEVAIDPELLGKAYEKFNAIRPDNYTEFLAALKSGKKGEESKFNKQYGVYYTPREIVHYMCQQSLINYLYTALSDVRTSKEDITIFVQQGESLREHEARVVRSVRETDTYSYQLPEPIRSQAGRIDQALANIKVCDPAVGSGAFPVGMMSEIVRSRQALAIFTQNDKSAYDFKRECIENSLYGVDIDPGAVEIAKLRLWLSLIVDEDDPHRIKPLPNLDYKIVCGNSLVGFPENWGSSIEQAIEALIHQHLNETNVAKKNELKERIDEKITFRYANSIKAFGYQVDFDFRTVFSEVFHKKGGFDVVIGNPPYLNFKMYSTNDRSILKINFDEIFDGKADYYYYFFVKAYSICANIGFVSLITSRYWLEAEFSAKLRRFLARKTQLVEIVDFQNVTVFEGIGIKAAITSFKKTISDHYLFDYRSPQHKSSELNLLSFRHQKIDSNNVVNIKWKLGNDSFVAVIEKIERDSIPLKEIAHCNQGIVTGLDKAFITTDNAFAGLPKSFIKTWIKVGDIHRYSILPVENRELVYTNLIKNIDEYPSLKKRLLEFKPKLSNRREAKNGKIRWFDLQWGRDQTVFDSEKLICRFKAERNTFCLDTEGCYSSADTTIVTLNDKGKQMTSLKYILALVNSRLLDFYFKSYGKLMDYRYEYYPTPVSMLRIKISDNQGEFIELADKILAAKRSDPFADTSQLEEKIDHLVYTLYNLDEDEILLVEKSS